MFKKWFSNSPSTAPTGVASQPQATGLVVDGKISDGSKPAGGPTLPARYNGSATILSSSLDGVTSEVLASQLTKHFPGISFDLPKPNTPAPGPFAIGGFPSLPFKFAIGITLHPEPPAPLSEHSAVRHAWYWPKNREALAQASCYGATFMLGEEHWDAKTRAMFEMKLVAATLEVMPSAIGVLWPDADAVWPAQYFSTVFAEATTSRGEFPVMIGISTKIGDDTENLEYGKPTVFGHTRGLNALGMMEVECRGFRGTWPELSQELLEVADYLVKFGPILGHGNTIGGGHRSKRTFRVMHERSTVSTGEQVYALYHQPRH